MVGGTVLFMIEGENFTAETAIKEGVIEKLTEEPLFALALALQIIAIALVSYSAYKIGYRKGMVDMEKIIVDSSGD